MKLIHVFLFVLLTLSFNLALADQDKNNDATDKNVPKATPAAASAPKEASTKGNNGDVVLNIEDLCKDTTDKATCESNLKALAASNKDKQLTLYSFVEEILTYSQTEFDGTVVKVKDRMRDEKADAKVKEALSNCLKIYSDLANEAKASYLAVRSKKFGPEVTTSSHMASKLTMTCEDGLTKVGTSGEKLGLYNNYKDHEAVARSFDSIIQKVSGVKKAGAKS